MDLRAVRDGLLGGCFARALIVMPSLNCGTSVNAMSVVAKARKLKERLFHYSRWASSRNVFFATAFMPIRKGPGPALV